MAEHENDTAQERRSEGGQSGAGQTEAEESRDQIEREFIERVQREMYRLPVKDHLQAFLTTLPSIAFMRMGLTEETRGERDLEQARLAVEAFRVLVDVLAPSLSQEEAGMFRSTLAQMQMAYVGAAEQPAEGETKAGGQEVQSDEE